jgi:hypothetical protein
MKNRRTFGCMVSVAVLLWCATVSAQESSETRSDVPELGAMHEVIYPLWHQAWPSKDMKQLRELLPQIQAHVAALQKAALPGILRDKQEKWEKGVAAVAASSAALGEALAKDQQQAALDAVEALHSGFEGLMRLIRPPLKEVDAYHQVLYKLYHHDLPQKNLPALRADAEELVKRCEAIGGATLPRRHAGKEDAFKTASADLCEATKALAAMGEKTADTQLMKAVEEVHTRYQALARLFE